MQNIHAKIQKASLLVAIIGLSFTGKLYAQDAETLAEGPQVNTTISGEETPEIAPAQIKVFPNPSTGPVKLMSTEPIQEVKLLTLTGQEVDSYLGFGYSKITLHYENMRSGMYVMQIIHEDGQTLKRSIHLR
ncbi:MAG TPA: hypothetical protein DCE41_33660 [Cytophagales bacterium]|nr:hypothetical protein [Cytophagales bacterium]HAA21516.1 hypothetical protein [Cytophagales bacterium]HAP58082.1 hypothetical protein [Cytophagales bacterium]